MTFVCKLSEAMVAQILSRLPPKSLIRFKCVGTSWYTLLTSPRFVEKQLSNSMHNAFSRTSVLFKYFVIHNVATLENEIVFSLVNFCNDNDSDEHNIDFVTEHLNIPPSMGLKTRGQIHELDDLRPVRIVGQCNGIICLSGMSKIILWNPAIREFKIIPEPCFTSPPDSSRESVLGFGYDNKSKDYKIVNIVPSGQKEYDEGFIILPPKTEVYTTPTNFWKEFKTDRLETKSTIIWPDSSQLYFKGTCYWMGHEQQKAYMSEYGTHDEVKYHVVLVFDMGDEVFDNILLPDSLYEPTVRRLDMRLMLWNESIALLGFYRIDGTGTYPESFGIWVMDNSDSVKGFWKKYSTFEPLLITQKTFLFWKCDEVLMVTHEGLLFSYNPLTDNINYLPIQGINSENFEAVICGKSLVSFNGRQQA